MIRSDLDEYIKDKVTKARQHWQRLSPHIKDRPTAEHLLAVVEIAESLLSAENLLKDRQSTLSTATQADIGSRKQEVHAEVKVKRSILYQSEAYNKAVKEVLL